MLDIIGLREHSCSKPTQGRYEHQTKIKISSYAIDRPSRQPGIIIAVAKQKIERNDGITAEFRSGRNLLRLRGARNSI